jgi:hypothetical protein
MLKKFGRKFELKGKWVMKKSIFKILILFSINLYGAENYTLAIDNVEHKVVALFEDLTIEVYTNKVITGTSQVTKAIYGNINGKNTASLLTINDQYTDGDMFMLKVYQGDILVGESNEIALSGDFLQFNDITTRLDYLKIGLSNQEKAMFMILSNRSTQLNQDQSSSNSYMNIPTPILIEALKQKEKRQ